MDESLALTLLAGAGALAVLPKAWRRLQLSRAKHRSLAGHSKMAKRLARLLPGYAYDEANFFASDDAPAEVVARRRAGFERLAGDLEACSPRTLEATRQARASLPDLQFTGAYRVPFQYSPWLRQHLAVGAFWQASEGVMLEDLDGQRYFDLAGSYGVNVLGYDAYKDCMAEAALIAGGLGPVLGGYHPVVLDNLARLKAISGHEQFSFHMSGTEAVMQAVRLARYHTKKRHLVRFCGAYHGWWEDVQPGPGNPLPPRETYTLADMSEQALRVLDTRKDIACVLVNPLQALHPNANAPGDGQLLGARRTGGYDRAAYTAWLQRLREVCTRRGIVLIFDEVFLGFRLAIGGAQQYFGVQADLVTYGKTLGGGYPVGVVCGPARLMQRWRAERPADICFARGTFNAHPMVMAAMNAFLRRLDEPQVRALYDGQDARWDAHAARFNAALQAEALPVRVAHLGSVWTVQYTQASRYHWMLQFYLRRQGLALSWVGTGRFIFSLNYGPAEMDAVLERLLAAARQMREDGWWWQGEGSAEPAIRRRLRGEFLRQWWRGDRAGG